MIGDNWENDIEGAKKYGIDQVYYNPRHTLHNGKPTFEIERLEQLKEFLWMPLLLDWKAGQAKSLTGKENFHVV